MFQDSVYFSQEEILKKFSDTALNVTTFPMIQTSLKYYKTCTHLHSVTHILKDDFIAVIPLVLYFKVKIYLLMKRTKFYIHCKCDQTIFESK